MPTRTTLHYLATLMPRDLPVLYCPFPAAIHPDALAIQASTQAWADSFGLLDDLETRISFNQRGYGTLMARAYPNALAERMPTIADWSTSLFLLDDQLDRFGRDHDASAMAILLQRLMKVLKGSPAKRHDLPIVQAMGDVTNRLVQGSPEAWQHFFFDSLRKSFAAVQWEANNRAQGYIPTQKTYAMQRLYTSGTYLCLALIEFGNNEFLHPQVRLHPMVRRLCEYVNRVVFYSNDIISLRKELLAGDWQNLVYLIHAQHQLPIGEALNYVARLHNDTINQFTRERMMLDKLAPEICSPTLYRFVDGLATWMRANHDWSTMTSRYQTSTEGLHGSQYCA
ncbi:terpene synthase family protein [Herpetosiphon geysericola]|uniref:Terpene synthase n=1 Tax=Herpetosiphon geysericola TaxID=70996 RepID=A0A0P6YAS9_9CHLR|nr:hypothetical protein [Herpetosiphon geysericola]KPL88812.1 hypothetical protein SE18_09015 [Herpetosiphon geysericola]